MPDYTCGTHKSYAPWGLYIGMSLSQLSTLWVLAYRYELYTVHSQWVLFINMSLLQNMYHDYWVSGVRLQQYIKHECLFGNSTYTEWCAICMSSSPTLHKCSMSSGLLLGIHTVNSQWILGCRNEPPIVDVPRVLCHKCASPQYKHHNFW